VVRPCSCRCSQRGWREDPKPRSTPYLQSSILQSAIDIGKNAFHVAGLDERVAIVLRQKWSHGQLETRLINLSAKIKSACGG
jgi:hypothetical protein